MNHPQTILTGDRPTGQLHLGHYVGSLRQRVALQHNHQQFILIADLQGLTDNGSNPQKITTISSKSWPIIWPSASTQAHHYLPAVRPAGAGGAQRAVYEYVTVARVERNPTVKNEIARRDSPLATGGFSCLSDSQAADITAFKAELVPVGDDQLPMIEQTNEIVHKMNSLTGEPVLRHCKPTQRSESPAGRRWKRQNVEIAGNTLTLSATEEEIHHAVSAMYTDRRT
ncbi:tryptophanyl-tRNA synthetase [Klebsiella pneumoniae]|uniref:tryptophan--tRNA ligase n=1 Tax=Klebsiella pneumoniae TaxID=573 RepID=A0A2X3F7T5_KLEPN|nr:tryptophanyl-tRNA synthetase [Klebsiella pneumoniae]